MGTTTRLTRGERNNNPGNIRQNPHIQWKGLVTHIIGVPSEAAFCQFIDSTFGIRAIGVTIHTYVTMDKIDSTVDAVISRWAPTADNNNTSAYIASVSYDCNVGSTDSLDFTDVDTLKNLVKGIITHENGRCIYADAYILNALEGIF